MGSRGQRGRWRKCHEDGLAARVRHDLTGLLPRAAHFDILHRESPRQVGVAKARRVPGSPGAEQTTRVEREAVGSRCAPIRPSSKQSHGVSSRGCRSRLIPQGCAHAGPRPMARRCRALRWTRQCRVPTAAEGNRRDSLRWRTAPAFSTRNLDPRFVREQPRFVACVDDRTTVGSDPSTGSRRVIVRWQLYKSANGATRHVESSVGRGTPRRSP
jgi:hypothetical protein